MKKFFITATGTGIGKTFITTTICKQLIAKEKKIIALKPVISGYNSDNVQSSDTAIILQNCGLDITQENIEKISPWRFYAPLSPDMAAAKEEKKNIDLEELIGFCRGQEKSQADILIVEGVGGVCVPLNNEHTVLDWIERLDGWKIILVIGSYLGTLSHTLTAFYSLSARNLQLHAVIVNESDGNEIPLENTMETLARFLPKSVAIMPIMRQKNNKSFQGTDIVDRLIL